MTPRMLAPIVSIKHMINIENASIADNARRSFQLIAGVAQTAVVNVQDVVEGSIIKAVYLELWFKGNAVAGTEDKFQLIIEKVPAGQTAITFAQMNSLMGYENKKNILHSAQGVTGDLTTQALPIFRGWLKIPKGKQRFSIGDELRYAVSTTGATANNCGLCIFKEFK